MSFDLPRRAAAALLLALAIAGCSRNESPAGVVRVAVMAPENLTGDPALDWVGAAVAGVLHSDLTGVKGIQPVADRANAGQVVLGYYALRGATLRLHVVLRDAVREKTANTCAASGPADAVLALANTVARCVHSAARAFGTKRDDALRAYAESLRGAGVPALEKAVAADPDFGEAWIALLERRVEAGENEQAREVVRRVNERKTGIRAIERARLDWMAARLAGDVTGQSQALEKLAGLLPGDPSLAAAAGQAEQNARRFANAASWFRKAAGADPANQELWNLTLYACAYAGDAAGVRAAFEAYIKAAPGNANAYDSLGEAEFYLGRFDEAAKAFEEAYQADAAFLGGWTLAKAAHSRFMAGGRPQADGLFAKFLVLRKQLKDPLADYYEARWQYATGRREAAVAKLEQRAATVDKGDAAALILAQLAAWKLAAGDAAGARPLAARAGSLAAAPAVRMQAILCEFASQPKATPEEWRARAERMLPGPALAQVRELALGYALLLSGEYAAAGATLRSLYDQTPPAMSGEVWGPLVRAYLESGKRAEAKALSQRYPIPSSSGERVFEFLDHPASVPVQ